MSKAILYLANTNTQTVAPNGVINFGGIIRKYGCGLGTSGGNVEIGTAGYYDIDTNLTFIGTAGNVTIQLYKDGVAIPGAESAVTVAADTTYAVSIPTIVRDTCCCNSTITAVVSGGSTLTITNASIMVEKL